MEQLLSIGIVGVIVSLVTELITNSGMSTGKKQLIAIAGSIVGGAIVFFVQDTPAFTTVLGILGTATVVYDYGIKKLK